MKRGIGRLGVLVTILLDEVACIIHRPIWAESGSIWADWLNDSIGVGRSPLIREELSGLLVDCLQKASSALVK